MSSEYEKEYEDTLFSQRGSLHSTAIRLTVTVLFVLAGALNHSIPLQAAMLLAGLLAVAVEARSRCRLGALSAAAAITMVLLGLGGLAANDARTGYLVGLRAASGLVWLGWFGANSSWADFKGLLRTIHCPEWTIEYADSALGSAMILLQECQRLSEAVAIRPDIRGRGRISALGIILASAIARSFERCLHVEESKQLRQPGKETADSLPMLMLQSVSNSYQDGRVGLQDVNLELAKGEWIAVVGASGSGKTTLLKTIVGLLPVGTGRMVRFGGVVDGQTLSSRVDSRTALVFQDPLDQLVGATAAEDICWGLKRHGASSKEMAERSQALLMSVGIAGLADFPLTRLSFGERKRAAFASVLALQPKLLLCDEVSSGLDYRNATALMDMVSSVVAQGSSVVWVTHDVWLLPERVKRVLIMEQGRITFEGHRGDIALESKLLELGLVGPSRTVLTSRFPSVPV